MKNLNLLFNKTYYNELGGGNFDDSCNKNNKAIVSTRFKAGDYRKLDDLMKDKVGGFRMMTAYPGMLVGTGYAHGTDAKDDIKIGFSFDYVSGQPYIPGSSVKGLLRSYFKNRPDAVRAIIYECTKKQIEEAGMKALEAEIFDHGDVFLDAVVAGGSSNPNSQGGNLLDIDNITPHKDPLKDPIPLMLLRIMPGVKFEFRFITKKNGILSEKDKLRVFETMLELFGAGAKTNAGYGRLKPCGDMFMAQEKQTTGGDE